VARHRRRRGRRAHRPACRNRPDPAADRRRREDRPDSTQPRRAPAEHDRGPAAGGRAAPPARPLAVRDRAPAQAAARHHRRTRLRASGAAGMRRPPLAQPGSRPARHAVRAPERGRPRHHHAACPRPARTLAQRAHAISGKGRRGSAGPRRLRRRGRRPARTGRNPAHHPWPAQLPGQHHHAHARQRPGMPHHLRAGRALFLAAGVDVATPNRPAMRARHPLFRVLWLFWTQQDLEREAWPWVEQILPSAWQGMPSWR